MHVSNQSNQSTPNRKLKYNDPIRVALTLGIANTLLNKGCTLRQLAEHFPQVSRSRMHNYLTRDLEALDPDLFERVSNRLSYNKSIRHLRGGEGNKIRYQRERRRKERAENMRNAELEGTRTTYIIIDELATEDRP
jgi:putative DeoR family transcriptional regulator (stage III sporulation protein D)